MRTVDGLHATSLLGKTDEPNLNSEYVEALEEKLRRNGETSGGCEQIFGYIYAVLSSPSYRARYEDALKGDFPRVPLPASPGLYKALGRLGGDLVSLHTMQSPRLDRHITRYHGPRNPEVTRIGWSDDTVWLDIATTKRSHPSARGTVGFHGVPEQVWAIYVGGYQPCQKWLKDRKGRTLSEDDIVQYQKIVVALSNTIRLMGEIDEVIEEHGGWPGAFVTR